MVRDEAMYGTGQLPKFEEDLLRTHKSTSIEDLRPIIARATNEFIARYNKAQADDQRISIDELRRQQLAYVHLAVDDALGKKLFLADRNPHEPLDVPFPLYLIPTA